MTSLREQLLKAVSLASQTLAKATLEVKRVMPIAETVPLIVELDKMSARLNEMLPELNKLRGL